MSESVKGSATSGRRLLLRTPTGWRVGGWCLAVAGALVAVLLLPSKSAHQDSWFVAALGLSVGAGVAFLGLSLAFGRVEVDADEIRFRELGRRVVLHRDDVAELRVRPVRGFTLELTVVALRRDGTTRNLSPLLAWDWSRGRRRLQRDLQAIETVF